MNAPRTRDDHPFDTRWEPYLQARRRLQADPSDAEASATVAAWEERVQEFLLPLLASAPFLRIAHECRRAGDEARLEQIKEILLRDTQVRRAQPNEVILREGDYGTSAFVVLSGAVRVVLARLKAVANKGGAVFVQDLSRVVRDENLHSLVLGVGELFGEVSALGRMPRSATVLALGAEEGQPTELLEIRWQGLRDLRAREPFFRRWVDRVYRRNSLQQHLLATPFLRWVGDSAKVRQGVVEGTAESLRDVFMRLGWERAAGKHHVGQLRWQLRVTGGPHAGLIRDCPAPGPVEIGRGDQAHLCLPDDASVSREHATLSYRSGGWRLYNRSRFGTIVRPGEALAGDDEELVEGAEVVLSPGDTIELGESTTIVFELAPSAPTDHWRWELELLARSGSRGAGGTQAYLVECEELPEDGARRRIERWVSGRSPRHVIVYRTPSAQRWRWYLPQSVASLSETQHLVQTRQVFGLPQSGSDGPQELVVAGDPLPLIERLLRALVLEEIGNAAEFESHGRFEWSRRTPEEHVQGTDWGRLGQQAEVRIAECGGYCDGVLLVRSGFARLTRDSADDEERTVGYLGRGQVFGWEEVVEGARRRAKGAEPPALRHGLRALGYVETLFLSSDVIERLVLPFVPAHERPTWDDGQPLVASELRDTLIERRLINGRAALVIDLERCVHCDDCVRACADTHDGQPRFVRHGPRVGPVLIASACMHCVDPVCMIGCPTGAIHRTPSGEIRIEDSTCIGCATCANNCPYDSIRMVGAEEQQRATKCDLCYEGAGPACVAACGAGALARLDLTDAQLGLGRR
ncbi:MAG: cyclic nucleotide-binding domain-containing protein [Planctomycetota bacterium]